MHFQQPLISAENLSVGYKKNNKKQVVLESLNLKLFPGEMVCLLGPNGIGKSTLIKTLSGVQDALNGEIFLKDKPINAYNSNELAKFISLVLTEKIPAGNMDVYHLVSLGRYPYTGWTDTLSPEDTKKVDWAIEATHVGHLAEKKVNELSDGELQKSMIARALAQDGSVVILDEPTAHLDLNNRIEIMMLLKNLSAATGKSILTSTHDLDLALQVADKLWLCAPEGHFFDGAPEDMILSGKLAKTFEKPGFQFNPSTGKFQIKSDIKKDIKLVGDGIAAFWTEHALERCGYKASAEGEAIIQVKEGQEGISWTINLDGKHHTFKTIGQLLDFLKNKISLEAKTN